MVKRLLATVLTAAMMIGLMAVPAAANQHEITVAFNRHPISMDVAPQLVNGRTLVPFRAIFEKMGASVSYEASTRTITATRGSTTISLQIGSSTATVNGQARTLDAAPAIVDDRTMVPLRFVGEALGATVNYDAASLHINIQDPNYPRRGGTVTGALWSAPVQKLNPLINQDWYTSQVLSPIFSGFWYFNDQMAPTPDLATHWDISDDNLTITFHMRKDAKFHDGVPVTAHDMALSYYAIMHPDYKGTLNVGYDVVEGYDKYHTSGNKADLTGLRVLDDHTLQWKLTTVDATFFISNTAGFAIPRHKYNDVPIADWGTSKDPNNVFPVGSGPFKFAQYVDGQYVLLKKNELYYRGEVYLDQFIWRVAVPDLALGLLRTSDVHFADVKIQDLDAISKVEHVSVVEYPDLVWQHLTMNLTRPVFQDKQVRKAIAHLIDRPALIDQLLQGHASSMYAPIHPLLWAYTDDVEKYPRNLSRSAELLTAAGYTRRADGWYKDGNKLSLRLMYPSGNPVRMASAPVIQQWLAEGGIEVTLDRYDFGTLLERLDTFDYDIVLLGWAVTPEPDPRGIYAKSQIGPELNNFGAWTTELSETLMEKAVRTLDIAERIEIYHEWQRHFADEAAVLPLYAPNTIYGVNKKFMNFRPTPVSAIWNLEEWWLER